MNKLIYTCEYNYNCSKCYYKQLVFYMYISYIFAIKKDDCVDAHSWNGCCKVQHGGKKNQASFMFFSYPKCHQYHGWLWKSSVMLPSLNQTLASFQDY